MGAHESGRLGEESAGADYSSRGFSIIEKNYRSRYGEIDIIATDSNYIVFIEVKTRLLNSMILPREAVDLKKQTKIIKTAQMYLSENGIGLLQPRFDVAEVSVENKNNPYVKNINIIENAFGI